MHKGPKPAEVQLSEEERNELEAMVRRHSTPQQLAKRGRMILGAAEGKRNAAIARELGANVDTVRKWRSRYALRRLPANLDPTLALDDVQQLPARVRVPVVSSSGFKPNHRRKHGGRLG